MENKCKSLRERSGRTWTDKDNRTEGKGWKGTDTKGERCEETAAMKGKGSGKKEKKLAQKKK